MYSFLLYICFVFVLKARGVHSKGAHDWGYYKHALGPLLWSNEYALCRGTKQSPVRIVPTHVIHNPFLESLRVNRYNSTGGYVLSMYNNGKSVQVRLSGGPYIDGAGLDGPYDIAQFHFHWGSTPRIGSEHVLDHKRYPMEVHLVHYARKYRSLEIAMKKPDGLAVIGVFFQVVDRDNPHLDAIVSKLSHITIQGQNVMIKKFNLMSMLPDERTQYYSYHGSLTTPPCYESVKWTVFHTPINISERQLNRFRQLHRETKVPTSSLVGTNHTDASRFRIVNNFRPLQRLNGRIIYSSFVRDSRLTGSSASARASTNVVLLGLLCVLVRLKYTRC